MRGDGTHGSRGGATAGEAADRGTLADLRAPVPSAPDHAAWADEDDAAEDDRALVGAAVPGYADDGYDEDDEYDEYDDGYGADDGPTATVARLRPDPLDEEDALYDDYDDEYDDDGYADGYDPASTGRGPWPPPGVGPADTGGGYGYVDDGEGYDDDGYGQDGYDDDGYAAPAATATAPAAARGYEASVGYDGGPYDEYDDGPYDEDDPYGESAVGYEPAWLDPAPAVVGAAATASAGAGVAGGDPAIWAPGTAPGAWVPLGRPRFGNPLPELQLAGTRTRRRNLSVFSLVGLTNVLLLAYAVTAVLLAAFTAALARRLAALQGVADDAARADALARSEYFIDVTAFGVVALLGVTVVASMAWTGVAAHNQRLLADRATAPSPALAVLGWIVPVANLVLPLRAVSAIGAGPWQDRARPRAAIHWWVSWVVALVTCSYSIWAAESSTPEARPSSVARLTLGAVIATGCFLYCFNQASRLFREIAGMQRDLAVERD